MGGDIIEDKAPYEKDRKRIKIPKTGDTVTFVHSWDTCYYKNPDHEHRMKGIVIKVEPEAGLLTIRVTDNIGYRDFLVLMEDIRRDVG